MSRSRSAELAQRVLEPALNATSRWTPTTIAFDRADSEVERLVAGVAKAKACLAGSPRPISTRDCSVTIDWLTSSLGAYKPTIYNV